MYKKLRDILTTEELEALTSLQENRAPERYRSESDDREATNMEMNELKREVMRLEQTVRLMEERILRLEQLAGLGQREAAAASEYRSSSAPWSSRPEEPKAKPLKGSGLQPAPVLPSDEPRLSRMDTYGRRKKRRAAAPSEPEWDMD